MIALYSDPVANPVFYLKIAQGLRGRWGQQGEDEVNEVAENFAYVICTCSLQPL